jgi:lysophospholipase
LKADSSIAPIIEVPGSPAPPGGRACWLRAGDGTRLRAMTWVASPFGASDARGTVFVFGGRTEFAEKYFEVVRELLARGFAVATVDWRGQGLSDRALDDPCKGHVEDFSEFDDDFRAFMDAISPSMPKPWIGLAHSMGGNALTRALHDHGGLFSAAVMTAPMLGLHLGNDLVRRAIGVVIAAGNFFGLSEHYVPGGSAIMNDKVPFEENILTHDHARYALYQDLIRAEPKLGLGSSTFGWLAAAQKSIRKVMCSEFLSAIKVPVLIALAGEDRLVDPEALRFAAGHLPRGELFEIEGAYHEILIETDDIRAQFWTAFDAFVSRCLSSERF